MAEKTREQRAVARKQRRSLAAKPFDELDEAAEQDAKSTPGEAAKHAAATAAAAALAGALAGAAKAVLDRRSAESEEQSEEDTDGQPDEEQPAAEHPDRPDDPEHEQPAAEAESEPEEPMGQPTTDSVHEVQDAKSPDDEHVPDEHGANGNRGASTSDAAEIVTQARAHLKELLGADAERVSGLQRTNGNWSVTLEVVELRRIPDSTDVLSSYDVVVDDDGGVVSLTRGRRYRRSQVEES
jgi:hypothetical protein